MTRARGRDADMTQGNILRQYIDFALPLTTGLLFQQLYSAVDSIVVGNFVGETALGAVGSTGNIINMLIGVCNGLYQMHTALPDNLFQNRFKICNAASGTCGNIRRFICLKIP